MKKSSQVLICVIAVTVSILLTNNLLFSLVWDCRCADEYWAETQCEQVCDEHGGCAYFLLDEESCYCTGGDGCNCYYWLYCVDYSSVKVAHTSSGVCPGCDLIPD